MKSYLNFIGCVLAGLVYALILGIAVITGLIFFFLPAAIASNSGSIWFLLYLGYVLISPVIWIVVKAVARFIEFVKDDVLFRKLDPDSMGEVFGAKKRSPKRV